MSRSHALPPGKSAGAAGRPRHYPATLLLIGLVGCTIAGCDGARIGDDLHPVLTDPTKRHPIVVAADTVALDFAVAPLDAAMDAQIHLETLRFMHKYKRDAKGPLTIWVHPRPANQRAIAARIRSVRSVAVEIGVPSDAVHVLNRSRGNNPEQIMTLSYDRVAAIGPVCGDWSESVLRNPQNVPYPNYGCASQRNLAAMAARPTDFIFPAAEVERGGDKRSASYKAYKGAGAAGGGAAQAGAAASAPAAPAADTK